MEAAQDPRIAKFQLKNAFATVFTPSAPVDQYALFAGRREQVGDVLNAVNQRGQHVILFGERGVGKTSLANVLHEILSNIGFGSLKSGAINCDATDTYATIWERIFREIEVKLTRNAAGFTGNQNVTTSMRMPVA